MIPDGSPGNGGALGVEPTLGFIWRSKSLLHISNVITPVHRLKMSRTSVEIDLGHLVKRQIGNER